LHVNYEEQKEYPLKHVENREVKLDWRVEAMKLNKDRDAISYNDSSRWSVFLQRSLSTGSAIAPRWNGD